MKRIFTLLLLIITISVSAQMTSDDSLYVKKTYAVEKALDRLVEKNKSTDKAGAYAAIKVSIISTFQFSETEKKMVKELFNNHYIQFHNVYEKAYDKGKKRNKRDAEVLGILVNNEKSFRKMLTEDQLQAYKKMHALSASTDLIALFFMSDKDLAKFESWKK